MIIEAKNNEIHFRVNGKTIVGTCSEMEVEEEKDEIYFRVNGNQIVGNHYSEIGVWPYKEFECEFHINEKFNNPMSLIFSMFIHGTNTFNLAVPVVGDYNAETYVSTDNFHRVIFLLISKKSLSQTTSGMANFNPNEYFLLGGTDVGVVTYTIYLCDRRVHCSQYPEIYVEYARTPRDLLHICVALTETNENDPMILRLDKIHSVSNAAKIRIEKIHLKGGETDNLVKLVDYILGCPNLEFPRQLMAANRCI